MTATTGIDLNMLYTPDDLERFLRASGDIAVESCQVRRTGGDSFRLDLALKKLVSHRRLVVSSIQVCREGKNWSLTAHPLFNPVWAVGGEALANILLTLLQATEAQLHASDTVRMHFSVRAQFKSVAPEEPRAVFNEIDISEMEQLSLWCAQAQSLVKGKRVLDVAAGGGVSSKMLALWAQECLCVDWYLNALQIAFETFSAPNILHYWIPALSDVPRLVEQYRPDVICWFQALEPESMRWIASAMTDEMQLVMPRDVGLVTMAERLFESVRASANLIVCRLPKRGVRSPEPAPTDLSALWTSSVWQMRLSRNTLPITLNGVLGYAWINDIANLYSSVTRIPSEIPTIVEIGSFSGLSACIFAHSLRRHGLKGRIYCVDLWDTYVEMNPSARETGFFAYQSGQLRQLFDHSIRSAGVSEATPICEDSTRAWQRFPDESIDMLFVDGDHSYEGCLADLTHWYRKVKPDGVIIGHDYDWDTVRSAVGHFSRQNGLRLQEMQGGSRFLLLMPQASAYPHRETAPLELRVASCV